MDTPDTNNELARSTAKAIDILTKGYLQNKAYSIVSPKEQNLGLEHIRFIKLTKIVYEKDIKIKDKLSSIYSALHNQNAQIILQLCSDGKTCDLYLGVKDFNGVSNATNILISAIEGNLPGSTFETSGTSNNKVLKSQKTKQIIDTLKNSTEEISVVAGIPSIKDLDEKEHFYQGLENVILGMENIEFTAVFMSNPISYSEIISAKKTYLNLFTQLSIEKEKTINLTKNTSQSITKGTSNSISKFFSVTNSKSESNTLSRDRKKGFGARMKDNIIGTKKGGESVDGKTIDADNNWIEGKRNETKIKKQNTKAETEANSKGETKADTESFSNSDQVGKSTSVQSTITNKSIEESLTELDLYIERLNIAKSIGFWNVGCFFCSPEPRNTVVAANLYTGVLKGENTKLQSYSIETFASRNSLDKENNFEKIKKYISNYQLPQIKILGTDFYSLLSSTINTEELTMQMGLPTKSFSGLDVLEVVPFGNNLKIDKSTGSSNVEVGHLFNYDKTLNIPFELDINKFSSHVFVTGSTGSGKSNVTYNLLEQIRNNGKKFLVIEPAKGEYKDEFGGLQDVSVFSTNPEYSDLLKINPFSFPKEIRIEEHIDRFIEILNACWSMEASMPAFLKQAVEKAYISKGWDLNDSTNILNKRDFPTFTDLANILPNLINESDFSEEIKSNYRGALLTRVTGMINGIQRIVFDKNEITSEKLFDENVIVDLSRVPSIETKSLLMGVLFMKLQEHRMANSNGSNQKLKHVTVIEEAHNLLKKTSTNQNQESSNLIGKSVEMISNAIAEMRTYGEGFILADQAPGLIDESVIRNTNTKICLRLPSQDDRELVGKSMNLTEEQIMYLSKLRTGVAAVYQNNWEESSLCYFNKYDSKNPQYNYRRKKVKSNKTTAKIISILIRIYQGSSIEKEEMNYMIKFKNNSKYYKEQIIIKNGVDPLKAKDKIIISIFNLLELQNINQYLDCICDSHFEKNQELKLIIKNKFRLKNDEINFIMSNLK